MKRTFALALLTGLSVTTVPASVIINVYVPATSKIWLAGMPDGTDAGAGDIAPNQSPVLVTGLSLYPGHSIIFSATGSATNGPNKPLWGPDGTTLSSHNFGAQFGMSDLGAPLNSLVGVFLTNDPPNINVPPPTLTWDNQDQGDYLTLFPQLQQPFFIGDGLTSGSQSQKVIIPSGTTRLYLGTLDGFEWNNNIGGFDVTATEMPEPSTFMLLGGGLVAVGLWRRRQHLGS
jgi:hypothetical protein